jgi:hypothetical protein
MMVGVPIAPSPVWGRGNGPGIQPGTEPSGRGCNPELPLQQEAPPFMTGRRLVCVALVPPIALLGYRLGVVMLLVEDLLLSILLGSKTLLEFWSLSC